MKRRSRGYNLGTANVTVDVDVDVDEIIDDLSNDELRKVCVDRGIIARPAAGGSDVLSWTTAALAADLRSAFYRRDASEFEALLRLVAPEEFSGPRKWVGEQSGDVSARSP